MLLVGPLVLGEADVAIDPAERPVDLGLELHRRRQRPELRPQCFDEGPRRRDVAGVVELTIGVEPGFLVVRRDALEEGEGLLGEAGE